MAVKPGGYAVLEAVQNEMRNDPHMTMLYEYQRPIAVSPMGQVIDLYKEFGEPRIPDWGPIDEEWFVGGAAGIAMTGVRAIAHVPSMCSLRCFELVFNQVGKLRHMTGGQVGMPLVIWQDAAGRMPGMASQHADAGQEALYAAIPASRWWCHPTRTTPGPDDRGATRCRPGDLLPLLGHRHRADRRAGRELRGEDRRGRHKAGRQRHHHRRLRPGGDRNLRARPCSRMRGSAPRSSTHAR